MKKLFPHNDKLYVVIRELPHHNVLDKDGKVISWIFNGWKEHLGADHVLKTQTHFLYCETVQDISWEDC